MDTGGDKLHFYFNFHGEDAILITDKNEIQKVENWIKDALALKKRI